MSTRSQDWHRRLPVGAEPLGAAGTHFRVWAPASRSVGVVVVTHAKDVSPVIDAPPAEVVATVSLAPESSGYFAGLVPQAHAGSHYWLELDDGRRYADPVSRFQSWGLDGPSEVIDPAFPWRDHDWRGVDGHGAVVYEMHVGTFTAEGTYAAACLELPALAALGITIVELMPLAEFPGRFGWGYDGVLHFAPTRLYGRPDDLRDFVGTAHELGIGVVLDVVYNHFGPHGCHFREFAPAYFSSRQTDWGEGFNFDGEQSASVREYVRANAHYWIDEFHLDGLRLDATQSIDDRTSPHIIAEVSEAVRASAGTRRTWVVGENEPQDSSLLHPVADGGGGLDALWNDDFHHTALVALTGRREAYYTDYLGTPQEFISAAKYGFLYQGQWYAWQQQPRGRPTRGISRSAFVTFLQNHDQIANSLAGLRLDALTSPGKLRAMTALLLLGPWTPMLFQGQEFASSAPFLYFADHHEALAAAVRQGRREFLAQFPSLAGEAYAHVADPGDEATFLRCKLDHHERESHSEAHALHRSLIALRRRDAAFHDRETFDVDGAILGPTSFVLRFSERRAARAETSAADRLLFVNLGPEQWLSVIPEPLLSPYPATRWTLCWASEDPDYGGLGVPPFALAPAARVPAEAAFVLAPEAAS